MKKPDDVEAIYYGAIFRGSGHCFILPNGWGTVGGYSGSRSETFLPQLWRDRPHDLPPMAVGLGRGHSGDRRELAESEPEGVVRVHQLDGWTALAMWDRSLDPRGNCLSVFFVRGAHTFATGLAAARAAFPTVFGRFRFPVVSTDDVAAKACSFCGESGAGVIASARTRARICAACVATAHREITAAPA